MESIIDALNKNSQLACQYLFPDGVFEGEEFFSDSIRVDLKTNRYVDYLHKCQGTLFSLWRRVFQETPEQAERSIQHWLRNLNSPQQMQRFQFSPEEMERPDFFTEGAIEIFNEVNLYPGTTTLLAGYNGSGKSTLATQIALTLAAYEHKAFILSPEMPPNVTARILHRQATRVSNPARKEWERVSQHIADNFLISTIQDRVSPAMALKQFDQAYEHGCRLMILDSVTCVRTGHELYQQADFADDLRGWTRSHPDCYLLALAHMRKPAGFVSGNVSRYDIRGAGEISDLAGHVWILCRKNPFDQKDIAFYGDNDAKLVVDKNRATGKLTCKMLKFSNVQKLYHVGQQIPDYVGYNYGGNVQPIR